MSLAGRIDWRWQRQPDPPEPRALVAWGAGGPRLLARLKALSPEQMAPLQATSSRDVLVVCAARAGDLPWVDGAAYAAPSAESPGLWLPTLQRPDVPCDLLGRALQARHTRQPLLLWPEPQAIVPLDRLLPLSSGLLARIEALWPSARGSAKARAL